MLVTAHTGRENAVRSARLVTQRLTDAGIAVRTITGENSGPGAEEVPASAEAAEGTELVIVLGGDGSLLRAAEFSRPAGVPLIGVNLGHVGFLAEAEPEVLADTVDQLVAGEYDVQERMTIDVAVRSDGSKVASAWALNEATVEKAARERMIEVITEVDGRPLSRAAFSTVASFSAQVDTMAEPLLRTVTSIVIRSSTVYCRATARSTRSASPSGSASARNPT